MSVPSGLIFVNPVSIAGNVSRLWRWEVNKIFRQRFLRDIDNPTLLAHPVKDRNDSWVFAILHALFFRLRSLNLILLWLVLGNGDRGIKHPLADQA